MHSKPNADVVLEVEAFTRSGAFNDVSLNVRAGEVLGVFGFMGSGQLELARSFFGKVKVDSGTLRMKGTPHRFVDTAAAKRAGIAFVPESRRSMLFSLEPLYKNVSIAILGRLSAFFLRPATERKICANHIEKLHIRPPNAERALGTLSGGNQQKVALAKWLTYLPTVLVLCEPTRGMDVGAKDDVVRIVRGLREAGIGIVVVSAEPETVLALADRIVVMKKGTVVREFASEAVSKDRLLAAA